MKFKFKSDEEYVLRDIGELGVKLKSIEELIKTIDHNILVDALPNLLKAIWVKEAALQDICAHFDVDVDEQEKYAWFKGEVDKDLVKAIIDKQNKQQ